MEKEGGKMNFSYAVDTVFGYAVEMIKESLIGYESQVVSFCKKHAPYDVAVDVGAGNGYHTRKLAKLSKKVIAIEPVNVLTNLPNNVSVFKVAVGKKRETKPMEIYEKYSSKGWVNAGFYDFGMRGPKKNVEVLPLDDIVTEADLLKIDIEGYEPEALENASVMNTVKYCILETHNAPNLLTYQKRVFTVLKDFNVFASELGRNVSINDVPLQPKIFKGRVINQTNAWIEIVSHFTNKASPYINNFRLLCIRKGLK